MQGAPGAGKTALLHECQKRAGKNWKIADLYPNALWSPDDLLHCLGKESRARITGASAEVGIEKIVKASAGLSVEVNPVALTMMKIIQDGKTPLLLILDEAQSLGSEGVVPDAMRGVVTSVLSKIHNGRLGRPVMFLAAGLGTTESAFNSLDISRFEGESFTNLGRLDKESERLAIRDWLVQEGDAKGNPDPWIDAIAMECHGWPQHIISYAKSAVAYLSNNSRMTNEGLKRVLEKGNEFRISYYETRAKEFSMKQRQVIASFIPNLQQSGYLEKEDIMDMLTPKYGEEKSEKFFDDMLYSGILHKQDGGVYGVPIPSMQTWLMYEYGRERIEMPKREDELSKVRRKPQYQN